MRFTLALLASLMGGTALADSIAIPAAQHGIFDTGHLPPAAQGLLTSDAASSAGMAKQSDLKAEADIRQAADEALGQRIDALAAGSASSGSAASGSVTVTSLPTWHGANKSPVRLFGIIQDDGGAYNSSTISYPGGVTFKYPPIITGRTYVISFDDWGKGTTTPTSELTVQSVSGTGFTYQHVGPWPGNGQEWIIYSVEGIPN